MKLFFKVLGIPKSKQSARFRAVKSGNKTFVHSYQKKEVVQAERNLSWDIKSQLPEGFKPFDVPLFMEVLFVFPPPKVWSKKKMQELKDGATFYKETKPDLTDNLMKQTCDAMNGIVYVDDARICKVSSAKIYGEVPRMEIWISPL